MVVQELIDKLNEMGDSNWKRTANVRILANDGKDINVPDLFDVKYAANSLDIFIDTSDWTYNDDEDDD